MYLAENAATCEGDEQSGPDHVAVDGCGRGAVSDVAGRADGKTKSRPDRSLSRQTTRMILGRSTISDLFSPSGFVTFFPLFVHCF